MWRANAQGVPAQRGKQATALGHASGMTEGRH
jgi:hypothetical protein